MNTPKRNALVEEFTGKDEPLLVPIARFFDGNDDLGSMGCNLMDHPGIDVFQKIFAALSQRPDVEAIYAQIAELDPGADSWPFADTVYVFGSISEEELKAQLAQLEPDEVGPASGFNVPPEVIAMHPKPVLVAWWD